MVIFSLSHLLIRWATFRVFNFVTLFCHLGTPCQYIAPKTKMCLVQSDPHVGSFTRSLPRVPSRFLISTTQYILWKLGRSLGCCEVTGPSLRPPPSTVGVNRVGFVRLPFRGAGAPNGRPAHFHHLLAWFALMIALWLFKSMPMCGRYSPQRP